MNPLTNMKNVLKLSERELSSSSKSSWHDQYKNSAWIFVGGLPFDLTEGDIICVFSQYGEIVNINLVRDKATGKQKGFCFICYEDQRSTVLAVDNLNGMKILNRSIRVDHVNDYKPPKDGDKIDDETRLLRAEGCAPVLQIPANEIKREPIEKPSADGFKLPERLPIGRYGPPVVKIEPDATLIKIEKDLKLKRKLKKEKKDIKTEKKDKKHKKHKKSSKKKRRQSTSSSSSGSES